MVNTINKKEKSARTSPKIEKLVRDSNNLLVKDFESKEIYNCLYKQFQKLVRFASLKVSKLNTEDDFIDFINWFWNILKDLDLKKLYNSSNVWNLKEFDKLNLFQQFFYISIPYKNKKNFDFIKWWVCYHWSLFFYNFFNYIDNKNKFKKEFIYFNWQYNHSFFKISFKNKSYVVDPYWKSSIITEVKKWNKVYLSMKNGKMKYWNIKYDFNIDQNWNEIEFNKTHKKREFIDWIRKSNNFLINLKTYINWKATHLIVKDTGDDLYVHFDNYKPTLWDKDMTIMQIIDPLMEWESSQLNSFSIICAIIWIDTNSVDKLKIDKIKAISKKIDVNYLIDKLWIKKTVDMFN